MKTLLMTVAVFLFAFVVTGQAVIISPFPGLEGAIEEADIVAVIRIDGHIQPGSGPDLMSKHQCYVIQCLKGNLRPGQVVPMSLYDMEMASSFPLMSVHLVFLQKRGDLYMTCRFESPTFRLSPLGNEKLPNGETIETDIKVLLRRSMEYWDGEWEKERQRMLKIIQ